MAYRTVLAVTGPSYGDGDLKIAAELCEKVNAHLSGLFVSLAAPPPIGEYAAVVSTSWLEERQADLNKLKDRTSAVAAFLSRSAVSGDVVDDYPDNAWADEVIGEMR